MSKEISAVFEAAGLLRRGRRREAAALLAKEAFPDGYGTPRVLHLLLLEDYGRLLERVKQEFPAYPVPKVLVDDLHHGGQQPFG